MTTLKELHAALESEIEVTTQDLINAGDFEYTAPERKPGESRLSYMIRLSETKPVSGDVNADGKVYDPKCQDYV